jgi:hypothetical protein
LNLLRVALAGQGDGVVANGGNLGKEVSLFLEVEDLRRPAAKRRAGTPGPRCSPGSWPTARRPYKEGDEGARC